MDHDPIDFMPDLWYSLGLFVCVAEQHCAPDERFGEHVGRACPSGCWGGYDRGATRGGLRRRGREVCFEAGTACPT